MRLLSYLGLAFSLVVAVILFRVGLEIRRALKEEEKRNQREMERLREPY